MKTNQIIHHVAEEDYAYLSGFLKARETRFLKSNDFVTISRFMKLQELIDFLLQHHYQINVNYSDPVVFEEAIWKCFYNELKDISRLEPEPYLISFIDAFRQLFFWKASENLLETFTLISTQGSESTRNISRSLVDRFNFFEKIRSLNDQQFDWCFVTNGNMTKKTIDRLFDSNFQNIEPENIYFEWKSFINQESPVKSFDFDFTSRLDSFWKSILEKNVKNASYQTYGLDYCVSFFVKWILEIEAIMKVYFTLRFGLHYDLREELYLNAR